MVTYGDDADDFTDVACSDELIGQLTSGSAKGLDLGPDHLMPN